tara:strand:+ start:633 stop:2294 length:1662 start_codon:yes stop_codon:yes gene_type:complete
MPWGYVAAYYLYNQSKKRQQKTQLNEAQQSLLDFLNNSKTTNLSEKDSQLLVSNDTIQHGTESDNYLGPPFGNSSDDYIEVLIYDTQDNLLESGVVESTDYFYDEEEGGIKIKTGTVLRKMGYDRGRFKVLYNFLRKVAGSYETIVTDTSGNVVNGDIDESEINKSLFLKENKYIVHQISDTRRELRLVTQNIRDENYLRRFYKLSSKETKYQADETPISNIEFVGTAEDKSTSKEIKFVGVSGMGNEGTFDQSMKGGKIIIPNFFVIGKLPSRVPAVNDDFSNDFEIINGTEMVCSFRTVGVQNGTRQKNSLNQDGDLSHGVYHQYFEGLGINDIIVNPMTGAPITSEYGKNNTKNSQEAFNLGINLVHLHGSAERLVSDKSNSGFSSQIQNIFEVQETFFPRMHVSKAGDRVTIDLESTSIFETDSTVEYEWTIFGWDKDGPNWYQSQKLSRKFTPDGTPISSNADIFIESVPGDSRYAEEATDGAGMVAKKIISPNDVDRAGYAEGTRPGCRLRFSCFSGKTYVGVQLKIKDNTRNQSRSTALPNIYYVR